MENENKKIRRNRQSTISLIIGMLSLLYCLKLLFNFWVILSVFDPAYPLIFILPMFILAILSVALGYFSFRNISRSVDVMKGKGISILGMIFGFASITLILLPNLWCVATSYLNPPNYELVLQLQETPTQKITPSLLREAANFMSLRFRQLAVPNKIDIVIPDKIVVRYRESDQFRMDHSQKTIASNLLSLHLVHDNHNIDKHPSSQEVTVPQGFKSVVVGSENLFIKSEPETC